MTLIFLDFALALYSGLSKSKATMSDEDGFRNGGASLRYSKVKVPVKQCKFYCHQGTDLRLRIIILLLYYD
jgi:hypothetical protein